MKWRQATFGLGLVCLLAVAARAGAEVEEARAKYVPWSGYWWPIREGDLIKGPLTKYDQATSHKAADWEREHNAPGPSVPKWYGYCHAWSAAAVMEKEPAKGRSAQGAGGGMLSLDIADEKGMLTACHTQDVANTYGQRYNGPGDDPDDIYPDELWRVLRLYVKQQGVPLILDLDPREEVWNYPVYAYRVDFEPAGSGDMYQCRMDIWMADDGVEPGYVGTQVAKQTYEFTCKMRQGAVVAGSGKWVGASTKNHPDFAWYPYVAKPENPEVQYDAVKKLLDGSASSQPPQPIADPDNPPQPSPRPGTEPPVGPSPQRAHALSPLELLALVTDRTSAFDVDVKVDKFSGGRYMLGEKFTVNCASDKDGFLYLFYLDSQGGLKLLYPQPGQDNRIKGGPRIELPREKEDFTFQTAGPPGTHRVRALVTTAPLALTGLAPQRQDVPPEQQVVRPKPPPEGKPPRQVQDFTFYPTQGEQVQKVMQQFVEKKEPIKPEQVGKHEPKKAVGDFGQGEVAFYVGPGDRPKQKPEK
jgi:hypothetical protein